MPRLLFSALLILLLSACMPITPTIDPGVYYTQAVHTIEARQTQASAGTAVALLTQLSSLPSPTPLRITLPPPLPTFTPTPTPEPTATTTLTPSPCDQGLFIQDVSTPDGAVLSPGVAFVKTWRIQNTGDCDWTPGYTLIFTAGDSLNAPLVIGLSRLVSPGDSIDISVPMTAPPAVGSYQARWELHSPTGRPVQFLNQEQASLWVRISVAQPPANTVLYDFASNVCFANWTSARATLLCPGSTTSRDGSVNLLSSPDLESRSDSGIAIWLRPDASASGYITGEYPYLAIGDGDHFLSEIGCLDDSPDCDLLFRLDYRTWGGTLWNFGEWREDADGQTTRLDLDLNALAGDTVQFIFTVTNLGSWDDANAFWLAPNLRGRPQTAELVLSWHNQGGPRQLCQDLKIYLTSRTSAEARASSCDPNRDYGRMTLSSSELARLANWLDRLEPFDSEIFTPAAEEPLIAFIDLRGRGDDVASSNDIDELYRFAEDLYDQMAP